MSASAPDLLRKMRGRKFRRDAFVALALVFVCGIVPCILVYRYVRGVWEIQSAGEPVKLETGVLTQLTSEALYRAPRLSPDGKYLVAPEVEETPLFAGRFALRGRRSDVSLQRFRDVFQRVASNFNPQPTDWGSKRLGIYALAERRMRHMPIADGLIGWELEWRSNSRELIFAKYDPSQGSLPGNLVGLDFVTGQQTEISDGNLDWRPVPQPGGNNLAYLDRVWGPLRLATYPPNKNRQQNISPDVAIWPRSLIWSPDGRYLAFVSVEKVYVSGLREPPEQPWWRTVTIYDSKTKSSIPVFSGFAGIMPGFSADSKYLLFTKMRYSRMMDRGVPTTERSALWVYDIAARKEVRCIAESLGRLDATIATRDGLVLYVADSLLYAVPLSGGISEPLVTRAYLSQTLLGPNARPQLGPDHSTVYFAAKNDYEMETQRYNLYELRLDRDWVRRFLARGAQ